MGAVVGVGVVAMGTVTSAALKHMSHDSHMTGIRTYVQVGTVICKWRQYRKWLNRMKWQHLEKLRWKNLEHLNWMEQKHIGAAELEEPGTFELDGPLNIHYQYRLI